MVALLLHGIGQQAEEARALDRLREHALLLGRHGGDAARHDLAALADETLQQLHVLVVDLRCVRPGERAGLAAPEERPAAGRAATAAAATRGGGAHRWSPSRGVSAAASGASRSR